MEISIALAVFEIIDYLRSQGMNSIQYLNDPDKADVSSYAKDVWEELIRIGKTDELWKVVYP